MNYKCKNYSNKTWRNVAIFVSNANWDRIKFLSASSGKKTSAWAIDKLLAYGTKVPPQTWDGELPKSLCVEEEKWEIVKERARACNLSISRYVVGVLLDENNS